MTLTRAPLVPTALLHHLDCFIAGDTRYRSAMRVRQALWREEQGLQPGLHHPGGRRDLPAITLGSLLQPKDADRGANFLNPAVHAFVRRTLALREEGAGLQPDRLTRNLLSSEPLVFNALAPLALDLDLATVVFRRLLPSLVHQVRSLRFETSPCRDRANTLWLQCGTAFDAAVEVVTPDGEPATVFLEAKLSESCQGPAATWRPRYDEVARELALHRDPAAKALRSPTQEQFLRLHLLGSLMVRRGLTSRAHLLVLHPAANRHVAVATQLYANQLVDPVGTNPTTVGFSALTLEDFVVALAEAGASTQGAYLHHRYLDLQPVLDRVLAQPPSPDDPPGAPSAAERPLALSPLDASSPTGDDTALSTSIVSTAPAVPASPSGKSAATRRSQRKPRSPAVTPSLKPLSTRPKAGKTSRTVATPRPPRASSRIRSTSSRPAA